MTEKQKQVESTQEDDFWGQSSGDESVDVITESLQKSLLESGLGAAEDAEQVEESETAPEEQQPEQPESKEKQPEMKSEIKPKLRFDSHEKAEEEYRKIQSEADRAKARLGEIESQLAEQQRLVGLMDKLSNALGDVQDDTVQKAIQEIKAAAGQPVLDRSRVDHRTATEVEKVLAQINQRLVKIEAAATTKQAQESQAETETKYPFLPTIKEQGQELIGRFRNGELSADELVAEFAKIGYAAGLDVKSAAKTVAGKSGADSTATPGQVSGAAEPKSEEQILQEAIIKAMDSQRSFV